ncbi:Zn-dependent alcohol dehydrogenase [Mycobacterium sp. URHB0021]|jgi:Zn-dependent alcohol dehydrogenase
MKTNAAVLWGVNEGWSVEEIHLDPPRQGGPGVRDLEVGDHVVASFLPACGRCRWCATGHQNLCDLGAQILLGTHGRRHLPTPEPG